MSKVLDAEWAFTLGAECQGWGRNGIDVMLTADACGLIFVHVAGDDFEPWIYRPRKGEVFDVAFLNFLLNGKEEWHGEYLLQRNSEGVTVIEWGE